MKTIGRVYFQDTRIIIDAEPHVMGKVRKIFPYSQSFGQGKYTHKMVSFPRTLTNYRDVDWLMSRYPMECEDSCLAEIQGKSQEYDDLYKEVAEEDYNLKTNPNDAKMTVDLREHQISFKNLGKKVKRILLADKMGLGKTIGSLSMISDPKCRPALIVVPTTLTTQWNTVINEVYPDLKTYVTKDGKAKELPDVDVVITTYSRITKWQDIFVPTPFKTMIFDEIQDLRHLDTKKRNTSRVLSEQMEQVIGLSGTPIFNYGAEIWSVLDVISPNCLGSKRDFCAEWCGYSESVLEPSTLNGYLRKLGLMIRRTKKDIGQEDKGIDKHIITIDADLKELQKVQDVAKTLALSVLSGKVGDSAKSSKELDWKLRHATGVAKASAVCEFAKMVLDEQKKVIIGAWHRDFYDICLKKLKDFNPVMVTGSESPKQKAENIEEFINGCSRVMLISLRSAAGIDGLQKSCNTIIHGELDWSPAVHDQLNHRVDREGQKDDTNAYYLMINDGSDPFILNSLNVKRSQHEGVVEGKEAEADILQGLDQDRIKKMAEKYLKSIGEEIPEVIEEKGILKEVADAVRSIKVTQNTEDEMQRGLYSKLPILLPDYKIEREYQYSKRSRLDFLISKGDDKVVVECKINNLKRKDVYRQVRRYIEEVSPKAVILYAPWGGVNSFIIDEIPVLIINSSINSL